VHQNTQINQNQNDDDDDDDFADFVENPVEISQLQKAEIQKINQVEPAPRPLTSANLNHIIPPQKIILESFNYAEVLNRLFVNTSIDNMFSSKLGINKDETCMMNDDSNLSHLNLIENNDTWHELKTLTSINDASLSLKFKWYKSNLEDFYLKSLNVEPQALENRVN
jgi:hypothetical protein